MTDSNRTALCDIPTLQRDDQIDSILSEKRMHNNKKGGKIAARQISGSHSEPPMDTREMCAYLKVTLNYLYVLCHKHNLPYRKPAGRTVFLPRRSGCLA